MTVEHGLKVDNGLVRLVAFDPPIMGLSARAGCIAFCT